MDATERHDFVWIHIEAPDEAGHAGSIDEKIRAIENIDKSVIGTLLEQMRKRDDFRLLIAPDHKTPVAKRGHTVGPVPFLLHDSRRALRSGGSLPYDERALHEARTRLPEGYRLIDDLFAG